MLSSPHLPVCLPRFTSRNGGRSADHPTPRSPVHLELACTELASFPHRAGHIVLSLHVCPCHILSLIQADRRDWEGKWLSQLPPLIWVMGHRSKWPQSHLLLYRVLLQNMLFYFVGDRRLNIWFYVLQLSLLLGFLITLFNIGSGLEATRWCLQGKERVDTWPPLMYCNKDSEYDTLFPRCHPFLSSFGCFLTMS